MLHKLPVGLAIYYYMIIFTEKLSHIDNFLNIFYKYNYQLLKVLLSNFFYVSEVLDI